MIITCPYCGGGTDTGGNIAHLSTCSLRKIGLRVGASVPAEGAEHGPIIDRAAPEEVEHWRGLWRKAHRRAEELQLVIDGLLHIKKLVDGESPMAVQSELANYRALLAKVENDD